MPVIGTAIVRFTADAKRALAGVKSVTRGVGKMSTGIAKSAKFAVKALGGIGIALGVAGLVGAIAKGIKSAVNFEKKMAEINTILKATPEELKKISTELKNTARKWGFSLDDVTNSYYDLVSAGFDAAESNKILEASAALAVGGLTDLSTATSTVISVLRAYRMEADQADNVSSVLFETIKVGRLRMDDLAKSFPAVASMARAMNVRLEEAAAAFATLSQTMPSAEVASVALQRAMQGLYTPTEQALKAMARLGIETRAFDAAGQQLFWTLGAQERRVEALTEEYRRLDMQLRLLTDNIDEIDIEMAALNLRIHEGEFLAKRQNRNLLPREIYLREQLRGRIEELALQRERLSLTEMRGRKDLEYMNRTLEEQTGIADALAAELAALPAEFRPLGEAFMQVAKLAPREMRKVLPEIRAVRAALAFDPAIYGRALEQIGQAWTDAGSHIEAAGEMMETTSKSIDKLKSTIEVASVDVMTKFLPKLDEAIQALTDLAEKVPEILEDMKPMLKFFEDLAKAADKVANALRGVQVPPSAKEFTTLGVPTLARHRVQERLGGEMPAGLTRPAGFWSEEQAKKIESSLKSASEHSQEALEGMVQGLVRFAREGQHSFQEVTAYLDLYLERLGTGTEQEIRAADIKTRMEWLKRAAIKETTTTEEEAQDTRKEIQGEVVEDAAYMVAEIKSQLQTLEQAYAAEASAEGLSTEQKTELGRQYLAERAFWQEQLNAWSAESRETAKADAATETWLASVKQDATKAKIAAMVEEAKEADKAYAAKRRGLLKELQAENLTEEERAKIHKKWTALMNEKAELHAALTQSVRAASAEYTAIEEEKADKEKVISEDIQESLQKQSPYHEQSPSLVSQVIRGAAEIIDTWQHAAGQLGSIWNGIVTSTQVAWEQVKAAIMGPVQTALDWLNRLYSAVRDAFLHSWFTDAMLALAASAESGFGGFSEKIEYVIGRMFALRQAIAKGGAWKSWVTELQAAGKGLNTIKRLVKFLLSAGKLDLGSIQKTLAGLQEKTQLLRIVGGTAEQFRNLNRQIVFLKGIIEWAASQGIEPLGTEAPTAPPTDFLDGGPAPGMLPENTGMLPPGQYIVQDGQVVPLQSPGQGETHIIINIEHVDSEVDVKQIAWEVQERLEELAWR